MLFLKKKVGPSMPSRSRHMFYEKYMPTFYKYFKRIYRVNSVPKIFKKNEYEMPTAEIKYIVSSRLITDCFYMLDTDSINESIIDISGFQINKVTIFMERIEKIDIDYKNPFYAKSDLISTYKTLMKIEHFGGILAGVFHIHPGNGPNSITPSLTDVNDQAKRENVGYLSIGCIFSRDGWLRFFSKNIKFSINLYGNGVLKYENDLFKITRACDL